MTKRPAGRGRHALLQPGQRDEAARGGARGEDRRPRRWRPRWQLGRKIGKISGDGRQQRWLRRQPLPRAVQHRDGDPAGGRRLPEQVDKVMVDFGYPMGPFAVGDLAGLDIGYASAQAPRRRQSELPQAADRRPPGGDGPLRPEDRRRLVPLREGRPHAASRSRGRRASSRRSPPEMGVAAARASPTRKSCAGCCSPPSTRPARSWRKARPTAPATST